MDEGRTSEELGTELKGLRRRKRAGEAPQERAARLELIARVGQRTTAILELDELLREAVDLINDVFGYRNVVILLVDGDYLVVRAATLPSFGPLVGHTRLRVGVQGITGWVAGSGEPLLVPDVSREPRYYAVPEEVGTKSELAVPIKFEGRVSGVLTVESAELDAFSQVDVFTLQAIADQLAVAIENARLYEAAQREIAERKLVEKALAERTRALRDAEREKELILDGQLEHVVYQDGEHTVLWANRAACESVGATRQELIGRRCYEIWAQRSDRCEDCPVALAMVTGRQQDVEKVTPDGRAWYIRGYPVRDAAGEVVGGIEVTQEITERVRAERLLGTLNEAALAMEQALTPDEVLDAVADEFRKLGLSCAVFLLDESGRALFPRYLSHNAAAIEAAEKLAGLTRERLTIPVENVDLYRTVVRDRRAVYMEDSEERARQALPGPFKRFAGQIAGMLNISRSIGAPLITEERVIGVLSVQSDDLTENDVPAIMAFAHQMAAAWRKAELMQDLRTSLAERERAEAEREGLLAQIQEQALQVQQIMDTVPEGVLLLDAAGHIMLANPVAEGALGVLAGVHVGDTLTQLGGRPLAELLNPSPQGLGHEVSADGRVFEVIARPLEAGSESEGWVLVVRDVTREREVQRRAHQRERLATVGQLAAGIAHDFNNIMAAIVLYAQMLSRTSGLSPVEREHLATINQQAQHATRLIQQILDFGRRAVMERRPLDLLSLVKEHVKLLERTLPENIRIDLAYGPEEYTVKADPTRVQQAMMNLALNARDAMAEGGELRIGLERVAVKPGQASPLPGMVQAADGDSRSIPQEWVQVTVSDTGTGIPADILPRVFDPFFTTKEPGQGNGLGLSQVYGIVKQHEGEIDVTSEGGRGTTFTIYLPALPVCASDALPQTLPDLTKGHGEVILVVEDNPATRAALADSLDVLNYQVLEAGNGKKALAMLEERGEDISLVLSDVVMPGMGGIELLRAMRRRGLDMHVIMLTGHPLEEQLERLQEQGMIAWLPKPPGLEQLAEAIARALGAEF